MSTSHETPHSAPASAPSDKLLRDFRARLDQRWQEFDAATMQEADSRNVMWLWGDTRTLRDADPDFQKAKAAFDDAKSALASVKSDVELKQLLKIPGKLSSAIDQLNEYFRKLNAPEKAKDYNRVLAGTLADLTSLKAQVSNSVEDKKAAEVAQRNATEVFPRVAASASEDPTDSLKSAVPAVTEMVAGVGAAVVGTGLVTEKWWKETITEGFKRFKDWFAGLFDGNSFLGKLFWGLKDKIMGVMSVIGAKLGIKSENPEGTNLDIPNSVATRWEKAAEKIFSKLKDADSSLQPLFTNSKLLELSPDEIKWLLHDYSWKEEQLAEKLWFEQSQWKKVFHTLVLYMSPECVSMIRWAGEENFDKQPLAISFANAGKYLSFINHIRERWKEIDMKDISFHDAIPTTGDVKEFIWEKKDMLEDLHARFKGFTPNLLHQVHVHYSKIPYNIVDYSYYENEFSHGADSEWEFLNQKLPEYAKWLPAMLKWCAFGNQDALKLISSNIKSLTQEDLIEFFILSWWKTDLSKMNDWEKAQVVMRLALWLRHTDKSEWYQYIMLLGWDALRKESTINIPPWVRSLINDGFGLFYEWAKGMLSETGAILKALTKTNPWLAGAWAATIIGVLYLAIRLSPVARVTSAFFFLLKVLWVSAAAFELYSVAKDGTISQKKDGKKVWDLDSLAEDINKFSPS